MKPDDLHVCNGKHRRRDHSYLQHGTKPTKGTFFLSRWQASAPHTAQEFGLGRQQGLDDPEHDTPKLCHRSMTDTKTDQAQDQDQDCTDEGSHEVDPHQLAALARSAP